MLYLIIFAIIIFVMFALNPELLIYVITMAISVPIWLVVSSKKEDKEKSKRNAAYSAKYGRQMRLMTVYGDFEEDDIVRTKDGTVPGKIMFYVKESQVVSHSYKPAEAVYRGVSVGGIHVGNTTYTPGGMVSKNHSTNKGYIEASKNSKHYTVEKVELSPEIRGIYAKDPLYRKYAVGGTILCKNEKSLTSGELNTWSKLDPYKQAEYATMLVNQQCLSYEECKEIVTLLDRIQEGIFPEETKRQEESDKKAKTIIYSILAVIGILVALFFIRYHFF